ncbi:MAG: molybdenum ABC transporter ATP-binding protein [Methylocystis sp.]
MGAETIEAAFRGSVGSLKLDAAFEIPARGVTALFGPSGCGKTTVLRCIAGLARLRAGFCSVAGEIWQDEIFFLPTHKRPIGYVFQEASLFAHLSVRRNLLYGAAESRIGESRAKIGFEEVVDLLGLAPLLGREPRRLSGGERQRVAIGRALLSRPRLLLMDEPLSALDGPAKDEILPFLERLHESLSLPIIYVAHDMDEIERLADHLLMMEAGRVVAAGPLAALQSDPSHPLSKSRSAAVSLDAVVEDIDAQYGVASLLVAGGRFLVPISGAKIGDSRRIRVLASDVSLAVEAGPRSSILNVLPARVLTAAPSGEHEMTAVLGLGSEGEGVRLLARVTRRSWDLLELRTGMNVLAQVKAVGFAPGRTASAHP